MRRTHKPSWITAGLLVTVLTVSGCVATGSKYYKPTDRKTVIDSRSIRLTQPNEKIRVFSRDQAMNIQTSKRLLNEVVFYGANTQRNEIYVYGPKSVLVPIDVDSIRHIEAIFDGKFGWYIGAGILAVAAGAIIDSSVAEAMQWGVFPILGTIGIVQSIDEDYPIGPKRWQIQIAPSKASKPPALVLPPKALENVAPAPEVTPTLPVDPAPKASPVPPPTPAKVDKEAVPPSVPEPNPPKKAKPKEVTPDKKPSTVRDWLRKRKKDAQEQSEDDPEPPATTDP